MTNHPQASLPVIRHSEKCFDRVNRDSWGRKN
jgi:hypothetical protein